MGTFEIPLDLRIEARDVAVIDSLAFEAGFVVREVDWVEDPQNVSTWADWPGGRGVTLDCLAQGGGGWACFEANGQTPC